MSEANYLSSSTFPDNLFTTVLPFVGKKYQRVKCIYNRNKYK